MKSRGERTQPWGEPVFNTWALDFMPFLKTCCVLSVKKFRINNKGWSSNLKWEARRLISKWGCILLMAKEKSANRILAKVLGLSKRLYTLSRINSLASSTPLLAWYANCSGSSLLSTWDVTSSFFQRSSSRVI